MPFNQQESLLTAQNTVPGTVTIHFTDGTTQCFEFDVPEIDPRTSASKMQEVLARKQLLIHLPDRVLVIPMPNIKCMEFKPVPRLPTDFSGFMIRNARLISATQNET
jgi:hypothetical protein